MYKRCLASHDGRNLTHVDGLWQNIKQLVYDFYKQHKPDKLAQVGSLLEKFQHKEAELLHHLHKKYNIRMVAPTLLAAADALPRQRTDFARRSLTVAAVTCDLTCQTG